MTKPNPKIDAIRRVMKSTYVVGLFALVMVYVIKDELADSIYFQVSLALLSTVLVAGAMTAYLNRKPTGEYLGARDDRVPDLFRVELAALKARVSQLQALDLSPAEKEALFDAAKKTITKKRKPGIPP